MAALRFDGKVVIVTGAGAGLGRAYALLFASRGAKVVVNDLGGGRSGDGSSTKAADTVVEEIKARGGIAAPDYNSVVDGEKIVQTALENFGRVDVVINNAGILRDRSFARISNNDWDLIHDVHLKGAFKVTQAAWPHFRKQNYGRVIVTSSNAGIFGNFGQANYSAAKMGLIGLSNTLAIEGKKNNIHCNVLVPTAASRLTEDILPPDLFNELKPDLIAPVVVWLCHESCQESGSVIESAAGWATKVQIIRGSGCLLRKDIKDFVTPEDVRSNWDKVTDLSNAVAASSIEEATMGLIGHLETLRTGGQDGTVSSSESNDIFSYRNKDAILYSLGIGATTVVESDLKYLYESHENFSVFPTFGIIPALINVMSSDQTTDVIPNRTFDLSQILHGEQYLEILKPLPTEGTLKSIATVADVVDKGKGALIVHNVDTFDENGEKIMFNQIIAFVVGAGGFGGPKDSPHIKPVASRPRRNPDAVFTDKTIVDQAAVYRLSGDSNPLHIDPQFSAIAGYQKPILHGLCSLGFSVRHVLYKFADNDPTLFKTVKVRFVKPVLPGETLKTEMWRENNRIFFETSIVERSTTVLNVGNSCMVKMKAFGTMKLIIYEFPIEPGINYTIACIMNEGRMICNSWLRPPKLRGDFITQTSGYVDLHAVRISSSSPVQLNRVNAEELTSDLVFSGMQDRIDADPSLLKKINGVFAYVITKNGKQAATWVADLKKGKVYRGSAAEGTKVDTTITIDDGDMVDMAIGKLNPQVAFVKGKLKIKGNILLAQKLKSLTTESKL